MHSNCSIPIKTVHSDTEFFFGVRFIVPAGDQYPKTNISKTPFWITEYEGRDYIHIISYVPDLQYIYDVWPQVIEGSIIIQRMDDEYNNMKTFEDLEFIPDIHFGKSAPMAEMNFDNGYGILVFNLDRSDGLYEMAVTRDNELCYTTPITDCILCCLDPEKITHYMKLIQELPTNE